MKGVIKVRSLESIDTLKQDLDVGVVRVPAIFVRTLAKRNSLVRISALDEDGCRRKSIVRIVRAHTGMGALLKNEIALQYDDRLELGIPSAGASRLIEVSVCHPWIGLPEFLFRHPSPLVRKETIFSLSLMVIGALVGFLLGLATSVGLSS